MPSILLIGCDIVTVNAFLQQREYQTSTAQNASEAVTKARTSPYDLILFAAPPTAEVMGNVRTAKPNQHSKVLVAGLTDEAIAQRGWTGVLALGPTSAGEALVRLVSQVKDASDTPADLDNDFAECVVSAVGKSMMARFRIRSVLPEDSSYIASDTSPMTDFSALIALCCEPYEGIIALSFPKKTIDALTRVNADGTPTLNVAEVFNGVANDLATSLRTHGYAEREPHAVNILDTPQMRAAPVNTKRTLLWTFDSDGGKFYVQFFLAN